MLGSDQTELGNFISERPPGIEAVTSGQRWRMSGRRLVSLRSHRLKVAGLSLFMGREQGLACT